MTETNMLLAGLCVLQGLYISYQWNRMNVMKSTLAIATLALESAYDHIVGERTARAEQEYGFDVHPRSNYDEDK